MKLFRRKRAQTIEETCPTYLDTRVFGAGLRRIVVGEDARGMLPAVARLTPSPRTKVAPFNLATAEYDGPRDVAHVPITMTSL